MKSHLKENSVKLKNQKKDLKNIIDSDTFLSKVLELDIDGKTEKVLPRDVAFHVVSEEPIHIDFMRVVVGKKVVIEVPVNFINHAESPGLKRGGVLNIVRRKVELNCPADQIPAELVCELGEKQLNESIHISSIKLPENVKPTILDRDFTIATVAAPTVVKEPEPAAAAADGEAAAEGEAATAGEGAAENKDAKPEEDKAKAPADKKK